MGNEVLAALGEASIEYERAWFGLHDGDCIVGACNTRLRGYPGGGTTQCFFDMTISPARTPLGSS